MKEIGGKMVGAMDHAQKLRRDFNIADERFILQTQVRIKRRVMSEIAKVHQFQVTRMERYLVI